MAQHSVVKGYEYDKGRFVAIEPEELKSLAPKTSSGMEIQEFVESGRDRSGLLRNLVLRLARRGW